MAQCPRLVQEGPVLFCRYPNGIVGVAVITSAAADTAGLEIPAARFHQCFQILRRLVKGGGLQLQVGGVDPLGSALPGAGSAGGSPIGAIGRLRLRQNALFHNGGTAVVCSGHLSGACCPAACQRQRRHQRQQPCQSSSFHRHASFSSACAVSRYGTGLSTRLDGIFPQTFRLSRSVLESFPGAGCLFRRGAVQ